MCLFDVLMIQLVFCWFVWYLCDFSIAEFLQSSRIMSWTFSTSIQTCLKTLTGLTRLTSDECAPNWNEFGLTLSAIVGTVRTCWTGFYIRRPPIMWYWRKRYPKQYYLRRRIIARSKSVLRAKKKSRVKNRYRPYKAKYSKEAREFLNAPNFVDYDFDDVWGG